MRADERAESTRGFKNWDKNGDGFLVPLEVPEGPREIFNNVDRNKDGKVTLEEHLLATVGPEEKDKKKMLPAKKGKHSDDEEMDEEKYSDSEIQRAVEIAKKMAGSNYTGASNAIEKMKKGYQNQKLPMTTTIHTLVMKIIIMLY